jgi:hypothetical protein
VVVGASFLLFGYFTTHTHTNTHALTHTHHTCCQQRAGESMTMGDFGSSQLVTLNAGIPASSSMTCTRQKKINYCPQKKQLVHIMYDAGHSKGLGLSSKV